MSGLTKFIVFVLALLLLGGGALTILGMSFLTTAPSASEEIVVFEVKPGESFKSVARHLEEQGLVSSAWKLELWARIRRSGSKVRVGEYALRRNFQPREIMSVLVNGKSIEYPVTIPEGSNRFEIADMLDKLKIVSREEFIELTGDEDVVEEMLGEPSSSLEGYLFPETYHLTKYTGAKGFVRMMVQRFKDNYAKVQKLPGWSRGTMTDRQVVTLASIVEKETGAPEERPVISSVFHNRMRIKMPLQTDPTIIYGILLERGSWNKALSRADLQRPHPYNSYLNQGLPPGPISNPGFEALKAAGMPAKSDYLFFVSRNDGTHVFSREYKQHQKAVSDFQLNAKAREGKSWRDLQKRQNTPEKVIEAPQLKMPSPSQPPPKPLPKTAPQPKATPSRK